MNVAIINTVAMQRSTGKLAYNLYKHLKEENAVKLYYGRRLPDDVVDEGMICISSKIERYGNVILDRVFGNEGQNALLSTRRLLRLLEKNQTEVVYLMNLHAYYININLLFDYLSKKSIKVIYVMYDEYAITGKCCFTNDCNLYKNGCGSCERLNAYPKSLFFDRTKDLYETKRVSYSKVKDFSVVSVKYTVQKAQESGIMPIGTKFYTVDEGIDIKGIFHNRHDECLIEDQLLKNKKIILTVAPYPDERKGCKYFLEAARKMVHRDDYLFVHVGFNGKKDECPPNYLSIPYVSNQITLANYYSIADLFVCTSMAETIPNTCIEALACGTPILGFNISGVPTAADEKHGKYVEPRNSEELVREILKVEKKDFKIVNSCSKYAKQRYDGDEYAIKLSNLMKS